MHISNKNRFYELKTLNKRKVLIFTFLCACFCIHSSNVMAQGSLAGTNISNIATVSYSIDSTVQESIESSPNGNTVFGNGNGTATNFVVDRKIDLLVTGNTNANVIPGDSQAEVTFSLQNQGNAIQQFALNVDSLMMSDDFDIESCVIEVLSVTGSAISGVTFPATNNIKLLPDQQANVSVRCNVPLSNGGIPILSGQTSLLGLVATAEKNEDGSNINQATSADTDSTIETVFADGAGTNDLERDASHSATRSYIASTSSADPELTLNKTIISVVDLNGGNKSTTGSEVTYKIQIDTTGIGVIENLIITDPTPTDMTYKSNSILLNSLVQTDISDGSDNTDFGITTANTATIDLGNFSAGNQFEILVTYIIN